MRLLRGNFGGKSIVLSYKTQRLLLACSFAVVTATGCDDGMTGAEPLRSSAPILPVRFVVIRTDAGAGNALWAYSWITAVLAEATIQAQGAVQFSLAILDEVRDTPAYMLSQAALLARQAHDAAPGRLTVIISSPFTADSAGISVVERSLTPLLVMRARGLGRESLSETAAILLHEVGHCQGYAHKAQPFLGRYLTTENYLLSADGLADFAWWVRDVVGGGNGHE